jgi:threonine dehydrogenase-like Zn-dependent dehydrogenase
LREGQRVAVHVVVSCGKCYWCLRGQELYCPAVHGLNNAHAEYLAAPASHCLPIPDDVDWETALLIGGDTMGVGYRASTRAGVRAGEVAAVVGAGPVGLGHVVLLSFWGLQVIAVDPRPYRRALAQQLGAAEALAPDAEAVAVLRRYNDGRGPDFVFDCAGSPQALGLSVQAVRPGGTVAIIGERGETPIYPSRDIIHREIQLFGSWYFARYQFYEQVELVRRGMQPRRLITHRLPLEAAQEAYELMDAGECGKIIFTYS